MRELFRYFVQFDPETPQGPGMSRSFSFATETDNPVEAMRQAGEYLHAAYGKFKLTNFSGPDGKILVRV